MIDVYVHKRQTVVERNNMQSNKQMMFSVDLGDKTVV